MQKIRNGFVMVICLLSLLTQLATWVACVLWVGFVGASAFATYDFPTAVLPFIALSLLGDIVIAGAGYFLSCALGMVAMVIGDWGE